VKAKLNLGRCGFGQAETHNVGCPEAAASHVAHDGAPDASSMDITSWCGIRPVAWPLSNCTGFACPRELGARQPSLLARGGQKRALRPNLLK
jgi:hypothetical protein